MLRVHVENIEIIRAGVGIDILERQDKSIRAVSVEVVAVQFLRPQEAKLLIQTHGRNISLLRLEDNLVGFALGHGVNGLFDKSRGDAMATEVGCNGQHGDVTPPCRVRVRSMDFQLADDDADERRINGVQRLENIVRELVINIGGERSDHEAEVCPLAQKIAVDIDAVGLTQVLGDECADGGQILGLESMFVLDVAQFAREVVNLGKVHGK